MRLPRLGPNSAAGITIQEVREVKPAEAADLFKEDLMMLTFMNFQLLLEFGFRNGKNKYERIFWISFDLTNNN